MVLVEKLGLWLIIVSTGSVHFVEPQWLWYIVLVLFFIGTVLFFFGDQISLERREP